MSMIRTLVLILAIVTAGCGHCEPIPPQPITHTTYIPERPELPAATLRPGDSPGTVVRSLLMTIEILQGYAEQLEALID